MAPRTLNVIPGAKVAICIPCGSQVDAGFMHDLARMCSATAASLVAQGHLDFTIHMVQSSILDRSRCDLATIALQREATHVLFLDSDMRFPWDTMLRLLSHNVGMVGCNYSTRVETNPRPTAFRKGGLDYSREQDPGDRLLWHNGPEGLVEADAVGLGVCLIRADVLAATADPDKPWFGTRYDPDTRRWVGEDVGFCQRVAAAGYPIWVDTDLSDEVQHSGQMGYTLGMTSILRDKLAAEPPRTSLGDQ